MYARRQLEQTAGLLFVGSALVMTMICSAIIVSGWFAGVLEDHAERFFWAGAVLGLLMVFTFAGAAFPAGSDDARSIVRIRGVIRVGLVLFVIAPSLCLYAMVADFYRLLA